MVAKLWLFELSAKVYTVFVFYFYMSKCRNIVKWHCCDREARAASAQSFTLWQQITTEITPLLLVRATYMGVVLRAHPVCGESRIQRNASVEVATVGSVPCSIDLASLSKKNYDVTEAIDYK